jgi:hypothetical protein
VNHISKPCDNNIAGRMDKAVERAKLPQSGCGVGYLQGGLRMLHKIGETVRCGVDGPKNKPNHVIFKQRRRVTLALG